MVSFVTRSCISFLLIVLTACTTQSKPDWVAGDSAKYNAKEYLLGQGVGQDQTEAKHNATKKINNYFKSVANSDELRSQLNIIYNQIDYLIPWSNSDTNDVHVLAYISRDKAASLIQNKMLAFDELTYQFFEQAKSTTDLLAQTSYINGAVNAQARRLKLKPVLNIINSQNDIPSSYDLKHLTKIRNQLQTRINLQLIIQQDNLGELDILIKNSLDLAGFTRTKNKPSKNHLVATLTIEESKIVDSNGARLVQGVLITALQLQGENEYRAEQQWTFTVSANNHKAVIKKAREVLSAQLNAELKQVIMDMMIVELDNHENVPNQDYVDIEMPEFNKNIPDPVKTKNTTAKNKSNEAVTESTKVNREKIKSDTASSETKNGSNVIQSQTNTSPGQEPKTINNATKASNETSVSAPSSTITDSNTKALKTNKSNINNNTATEPDDPISSLPPLTSDQ